jgi:ribosome-associated protein
MDPATDRKTDKPDAVKPPSFYDGGLEGEKVLMTSIDNGAENVPETPTDPTLAGSPVENTSRRHLKGEPLPLMSSRERAILAARVADDSRARDVVVLDMTAIVAWVDYLVICSGSSRRQLCAIADDVEKHLLEVGDRKIGTEGYEKGDWIVLDFADVILHAFSDEKRGYYELEHLWGDAKPVEWRRPTESA